MGDLYTHDDVTENHRQLTEDLLENQLSYVRQDGSVVPTCARAPQLPPSMVLVCCYSFVCWVFTCVQSDGSEVYRVTPKCDVCGKVHCFKLLGPFAEPLVQGAMGDEKYTNIF